MARYPRLHRCLWRSLFGHCRLLKPLQKLREAISPVRCEIDVVELNELSGNLRYVFQPERHDEVVQPQLTTNGGGNRDFVVNTLLGGID
jgi:hypothetical protein